MILSGKEIISRIRSGKLGVTPFDRRAVGACSLDLRLGNSFRIFRKRSAPVAVAETTDYRAFSREVVVPNLGGFTLAPGQLVLGTTLERLTLPDDLAGWLQGRSRFARLGLGVHISSSLVQPGSDNVQVLEIMNNSPSPLRLKPGVRVCQVVFEELKGRGRYAGEWARQARP